MKKNTILYGSFFTIGILLIQLILGPSVIASDPELTTIPLSDSDKSKLESMISNFSGSELYDELQCIYKSNINDNNEIKVTALNQMIISVTQYIKNTNPEDYPSSYILSINELINFILLEIGLYLTMIPILIILEIFYDTCDLLNYYAELLSEPEFIAALSLHIFMPQLYDTLLQLELIKDYSIDLPDTPEERRRYIKEIFQNVTTDVLEGIVYMIPTAFYMYYLGPKMGYLSRMAQDISLICVTAKDLVKESSVKLEYFKDIFIDLPTAFIDFVRPRDNEIIIDFFVLLEALEKAKNSSEKWLEEGVDGKILVDLTIITGTLIDLFIYYTIEADEPWFRPFAVVVAVEKEEGETISLSFNDPEQTDIAYINSSDTNSEVVLYYQTAQKSNSYGLHRFKVVAASSNGGVVEKEESAFSDGRVKVDIDHSQKSKIKESIIEQIILNVTQEKNGRFMEKERSFKDSFKELFKHSILGFKIIWVYVFIKTNFQLINKNRYF